MHRNPGQPPADIDAVKSPDGHGAGRRSRWDLQHAARAVAVQGLRPARAEVAGPGRADERRADGRQSCRPVAAGAGDQRPAPGQGPGQGRARAGAVHRRRMVRRFVDGDAAGRGERRAGDHRRLGGVLLPGRHVHERIRPADHLAHPRGCVRLHPAAADGLPRPADRRRADQPGRLRHLDGGIDPAGCGHRPHPVRAHPGRYRRRDGRGGLAPRADRARRRPAGVPDRQPLRRPDPAIRPSQARRHRRPDRARHRVPDGHPHRARASATSRYRTSGSPRRTTRC